ncbi:MAG: 23S rRNA (adenine(2503)-C(2))-methyltransferase RlmN [bacterium]|nr:MAG: 23S rRNA (adenine(2503)-C(2))-methyltransferase RlmN [bacterium]
MLNFFDLSFEEIAGRLSDLDTRPFRTDQVLRWVYTLGVDDFMEMTDMPRALRESLAVLWDLRPMREVERTQTVDGTVKFLHILDDGEMIESVLIPEEGHNTLCISTQTGCTMSCAFCETGREPGGRDLTSGEILAQIVYAVRYTGERLKVRNLVFMGMGEPLLNMDSLLAALEVILSERGLDFSPRRVTVSTCGWVPGIKRLAAEGPDVNLAVSLNASDDVTRSTLMPVNRKYPIDSLMEAVKAFPVKARRRITFEYVLIEGVNDTREDARRLKNILQGVPSKVNLIPCNRNYSGLKAPTQGHIRTFQEWLLEDGVLATMRKSRGQEIGAACGQLRAAVGGK